jgi:6-pyruvoyltetrahydropterin/6-carboxytetrahydropterin synthase
MFEVGVASSFEAVHALGDEGTAEADRHDHEYRVEVAVRGERLSDEGMLLDLDRLSAALSDCLAELASTDLDELPAFAGLPTTVEHVAAHIWAHVRDGLDAQPGLGAMRVTVYESLDAWASVDRPLGA